jgi:hypothetical protein
MEYTALRAYTETFLFGLTSQRGFLPGSSRGENGGTAHSSNERHKMEADNYENTYFPSLEVGGYDESK